MTSAPQTPPPFAVPESSTPLFGPTSRYATTATTTYTTADGTVVRHLRRRFVPPPEALAQVGTYTVSEGERIDTVAAATLGDPELFWRIADANRAMLPEDLVVVGRQLRITLPDGIAGVGRA